MAVIAVDFDNVIVVGKEPLPGARDAINLLRELGHKVLVHSCNREAWIKEVLDNNDIRYDKVHGNESKGKPLADCYLDDKAIRFENWARALVDIDRCVKDKDNRKW